MKMRKADAAAIASLEEAEALLKQARALALAGGAVKTHRKIHSAVKSIQGAINHADRAAFKAELLERQHEADSFDARNSDDYRERGIV